MYEKQLLFRLCLMAATLALFSCRTDYLPDKESTYNNSSAFLLTSKKISLNESKHKDKLLSIIKDAEAEIEAKVQTKGKVVNYGNGVSIDTENVIYIENGPSYHTYTFHIKREGASEDAPVENLLLVPLPDGYYREFLVTYNLTAQERKNIINGEPVDTSGKTVVTELAKGTYNGNGQLARQVCGTTSVSYWTKCSSNKHDGSNWEQCEFLNNDKTGTPPIQYTLVTTTCIEINDDIITPDPIGGGGGGGGGGASSPCPSTTVPTIPQPGFYNENGCQIGAPTLPNVPELNIDPCRKTKASITAANNVLKNPDVQSQMDAVLKGKIQAPNEWGVAIGQASNGYEVTPPAEGIPDQNQVTIPVLQLSTPFIGDGHSHKGSRGNPSGKDMYEMIKGTLNHPGYIYRFVYGNNSGVPEIYALIIHNKTLAQAFLTQFPENENIDSETNAIKEGSVLGKEFYKAKNHYSEGRSENISGEIYEERTVAMAYILEKFNAGISLAHVAADGNLKKINASVESITVPASGGKVKEGIKVSNCP